MGEVPSSRWRDQIIPALLGFAALQPVLRLVWASRRSAVRTVDGRRRVHDGCEETPRAGANTDRAVERSGQNEFTSDRRRDFAFELNGVSKDRFHQHDRPETCYEARTKAVQRPPASDVLQAVLHPAESPHARPASDSYTGRTG